MLPQASDSWTLGEAAHLLNRAGFGGDPQEIQNFHALGRTKAVDSLLNPAEPLGTIPVPVWATREQAIADMRERAEQRARAYLPVAGHEHCPRCWVLGGSKHVLSFHLGQDGSTETCKCRNCGAEYASTAACAEVVSSTSTYSATFE